MSAISSCPSTREVLCFPVKIVSSALNACIEKVKLIFRNLLGHLLRVTIFMFGEYNTSWVKRQMVELYKSGCDRRRAHFDPKRLEASRDTLKALGATVEIATTADGVEIEFSHMRYQDVKKAIESKGGKWIEISATKTGKDEYTTTGTRKETIEVILEDKGSPEWASFYKNVLGNKMGWQEINLKIGSKTVKGFLTAKWTESQKRPEDGQLILRSHSPTSSWAMEREYTGMQLGMHADLCFYDYRGTYNSKGLPSEGGYYLDIEAVYQMMLKRGYQPRNIWSSGFCLGGAIATSLVRTHHATGLNLITENTFCKMSNVVHGYPWPLNYLAKFALPEIQTTDPKVCAHTKQNFFDTLQKLENLPRHPEAMRLIINTIPDTVVPEQGPAQLFAAAEKSGKAYKLTHNAHKHKNGHSLNPLDDPEIWKGYVAVIAERNPRKV